MFAVVAPGQGAQTVGMLAPWLRDPQRLDLVRTWSDAAGADLVHLGTTATAAEIERTEHTQPLLVAQGLLALDALSGALPDRVAAMAGHSVGELTVAAHAGVLSALDAVRLAGIRGRAMAAACAVARTSMAAVVGGEEEAVLDRIAELGLEPATFNGPGQIVAAGLVEDLARLAAAPPPGTTVKPLAVAGAFHTRHMRPARDVFAAAAAEVVFHAPRQLLLSNADGAEQATGEEVRARLVEQIVRPVRWDRCVDALTELAPTAVIALPPARTLTNLLKRRRFTVASITTPRDLATAVARFATPTGGLINAGA
jgi:[acyl-carrier-protein] S-malonyltransferase